MKNEISVEELNSNISETQEILLNETRNMLNFIGLFSM